MIRLNDIHCHFFSTPFFAALGRQLRDADERAPHGAALAKLGWEPPGAAEALADRWVSELDRANVARAAIIASVPGDAGSVAAAVARHPRRLVGFFMVDPTHPDSVSLAADGLDAGGLRAICLFPIPRVDDRKQDNSRFVARVNSLWISAGYLNEMPA